MKRMMKFLRMVNFRTLYFNFKYLPIRDAVKFPVLISKRVILLETNGTLKIDAPIKTGMIQIGFGNVQIFDRNRSRSIWHVSGDVIFKGKANIGHGTKISVNRNATVEFGDNISITAEVEIVSQLNIRFGKDVLISWNCLFMDSDFHFMYDQAMNILNPPKPVVIGDKVWIGCRTLIMKGSRIADGTIIGANSFLSKDISAKSGVYAGNPVQLIRENVTWKL